MGAVAALARDVLAKREFDAGVLLCSDPISRTKHASSHRHLANVSPIVELKTTSKLEVWCPFVQVHGSPRMRIAAKAAALVLFRLQVIVCFVS